MLEPGVIIKNKCLYPFASCFLFLIYYITQLEVVFQINSDCRALYRVLYTPLYLRQGYIQLYAYPCRQSFCIQWRIAYCISVFSAVTTPALW